MAPAPPDPGGEMGTPVSLVSTANRFLQRITAASTRQVTTVSRQPPSPNPTSNSLRPALHTSEPLNIPRPDATNIISPSSVSVRSRQSTDPDGSTGDEVVANLRAFASSASKALDAEIAAIHDLDTIDEAPLRTEVIDTSVSPSKLDPIESISPKTTTAKTTNRIPSPGMTPPPFIFSPPLDPPHIPWITLVSDACRQMILTIPGPLVTQVQRDMNSYANGDDSTKFILFAEFLFAKAHKDAHPTPSLDESSISTLSEVNVAASLSKVSEHLDVISQRLCDPTSTKVINHDDKQVMNSKYTDFDPLPDAYTYESMCQWKLRVSNRLNSPPWKLDDISILDMKDMPGTSERYRLRSNRFCTHLHDLT